MTVLIDFVNNEFTMRGEGINGVYPNTYLSAWDLRMNDFWDESDTKGLITKSAKEQLHKWGKQRLMLESDKDVVPNSEDWFGYQWWTGLMLNHVGCINKSLFINDGTGLGKTRSALAGLSNNFRLGPNIIVCPKSAIAVWKKEIEAVFPGADYISIVGDIKERRKRLEHVQDVNFTIISYESLIKHISCRSWPNSKRLPDAELDNIKWNSVIVDESHRIKNPQALRTRCCWMLAASADKKIAITATPITQTPEDLWAQWRFLSPSEFPTLGDWRERFLKMEEGWHGGYECVGWNDTGQVYYEQICGWRTTKRRFEDPEVSAAMKGMTIPEEGPHTVIEVPLHKVQRDLYDEMLEYYIAVWKDDPIVAKNDLEKFVRLRQIANGMPVTTGDGKVIGLDTPSNKAVAVKEIIQDADCHVVVFAEHSQVAGMIYRYLEDNLDKTTVRIITGDTKQATRLAYISEFQNDTVKPMKKILVCTTGTMSEAVSLTNAGLLIFAQEPASMHQFVQARGRVRRIGSNVVVPVISLRGEDTVESHLALRMDTKLNFLNEYIERITK